jgi:hypothetical protein
LPHRKILVGFEARHEIAIFDDTTPYILVSFGVVVGGNVHTSGRAASIFTWHISMPEPLKSIATIFVVVSKKEFW